MSEITPFSVAVQDGEVPRISGQLNAPELRLVAGGDEKSQTIIYGHCLASDQAIQEAAYQAAITNDPTKVCGLPGSYSAITVAQDRVAAISNIAGSFSLYYGEDATGLTISPTPLAVVGEALAPNKLRLAAGMVLLDNLSVEQSSIAGVSRLLGGQVLQKSKGQKTLVQQYQPPALDRDMTLDEAAERLRFELQQAVALRMENNARVSSDFSGGFDSTSLAFLALNHVTDQLPVCVRHYGNRTDGDLQYVTRYIQKDPRLRLHTYNSKASIFQGLAEAPWTPDVDWNTAWRKDTTEYHKFVHDSTGSSMHLSGDGGDAVLGTHPLYIADLLNERNYRRFIEESSIAARSKNLSPLDVWRQSLRASRMTPAKALTRLADLLENAETHNDRLNIRFDWWRPFTSGSSFLTDTMQQEVTAFIREKASRAQPVEGFGIADYLALEGIQATGYRADRVRQQINPLGFSLHTPYLDAGVIQACLALPATSRSDPRLYKPILQKALAGVIPAEVLQRQTKATTNSHIYQSLRQATPELQRLFRSSYLADLGIIEPSRFLQCLDRLDSEEIFPFPAVVSAVAAEMWLRGLAARTGHTAARQDKLTPRIEVRPKPQETSVLPTGLYNVPSHVYGVCSPSGNVVLLNLATDKNHPLNKSASQILQLLAATGDLRQVADIMEKVYPNVGSSRIENDLRESVEAFVKLGIVEAGDTVAPRQFLPTQVAPIGPGRSDKAVARGHVPKEKATIHERALAIGGFLVGKAIGRWLPQHRRSLLAYLQEKRGAQPATHEEASRHAHIAHQVLGSYAGRIACLEASYTAALMAAVKRRRVEWHMGVAFDPLAFHAWIAAGNKPVRTAYDDPAAGEYQSFFDGSRY